MIDLFMLNVDIEGKNEKLPVTQMGCLKCKLTFVSWSQKKIDPSWSCKFKNDLKKNIFNYDRSGNSKYRNL